MLYPPGFFPYQINPGLPQPPPQAFNVPYGHSNSYPMPCMVTHPRQMLSHTLLCTDSTKNSLLHCFLVHHFCLTLSPLFHTSREYADQYTNPGLPNTQKKLSRQQVWKGPTQVQCNCHPFVVMQTHCRQD